MSVLDTFAGMGKGLAKRPSFAKAWQQKGAE
jgi:hypothetical protein